MRSNPYGLDPDFDYESILGEYEPKKTKALADVAAILSGPAFRTGKKRYAVRVYRHASVANVGTYQTAVWADNLSALRLKLIKNIPWDLQKRNGLTTSVKIYRTFAIDKYNVAGWLHPSYSKLFFVWDPDNDKSNVRVDAKSGRLTSKVYNEDADYNMVKAAAGKGVRKNRVPTGRF